MQKQWPKELTMELSELIAFRISKYNNSHGAASNITQGQKTELEDALAGVFGQPVYPLAFASKSKPK